MKKKNIYTARIARDHDLMVHLSSVVSGRLECWGLISKGVTWPVYLLIPDFDLTDTISFDVLFDDDFRKENDVKAGDRFMLMIPMPKALRENLREIEIIDISEGDPVNNIENKRPVKQSPYDVTGILEYELYYFLAPDKRLDENGWFDVEELIKHITDTGYLLDRPMLELIVNSDEDQRYVFNSDKTKISLSPDHPAPKNVEELLMSADDLKIKRLVFVKHKLPFIEDEKRCILVESSNGESFSFPYETNRIFFIDKKRFFMLVECRENLLLAVSSYMIKNRDHIYRMFIKDIPKVINNYYPADAELYDFEGIAYRVVIKEADV